MLVASSIRASAFSLLLVQVHFQDPQVHFHDPYRCSEELFSGADLYLEDFG